jgi:ribosomal protein S21
MSRDVKHDLVEVEVVEGGLGRALKRFCALWKNSGITVALRLRRDYPRVQNRKRYKRAKALRRLHRTVAG